MLTGITYNTGDGDMPVSGTILDYGRIRWCDSELTFPHSDFNARRKGDTAIPGGLAVTHAERVYYYDATERIGVTLWALSGGNVARLTVTTFRL